MTNAASPIGPGPTSSGPISPGESGWALAWRMARREIRGSVARFRVFLGALMLGVAAIGTVGSVAEAMRDGIAGNARLLLGGDVELRSLYMPTPDPVLTTAQEFGKLSRTMTMRAMLQVGEERRLVAGGYSTRAKARVGKPCLVCRCDLVPAHAQVHAMGPLSA